MEKKSHSAAAMLVKVAAVCVALLVAVGVCLVLSSGDAFVFGQLPDPSDAAQEFFQALTQQDYAVCDKYIIGYSGLGLEKMPEDPAAAKLYQTLRESYTYTVFKEQTIVRGALAQVTVELKYFSLEKAAKDMESMARAGIINTLSGYSDETEVYNEDGSFRPEVYQEICCAIADLIIEDKENYMVTRRVVVNMKYSGGWRIVADSSLLKILCGDMPG